MEQPIYTIRPATGQDVPQMVALDQAIFGVYGADEDPAIIQARVELFPAGSVALEMREGDDLPKRVVGYLTTEIWSKVRTPALDEDPHETHDPAGTILNVTTLVVAPEVQNYGLGYELLCCAINVARQHECRQIVLETAHAKEFYLRHGFITVGERYQRDICLYIMRYDVE